jgi:hypothetical protein
MPEAANLENATKLMFAEFRISSIPMRMDTAFFLVRMPNTPRLKSNALTVR